MLHSHVLGFLSYTLNQCSVAAKYFIEAFKYIHGIKVRDTREERRVHDTNAALDGSTECYSFPHMPGTGSCRESACENNE